MPTKTHVKRLGFSRLAGYTRQARALKRGSSFVYADPVTKRELDFYNPFPGSLVPFQIALRDFSVAHAKQGMAAIPDGRLPATRRHYAELISRVLGLAAWPCEIIARPPLPRGFLPRVGKRPAFDYLRPNEDVQLLACTAIPFNDRLLYGVLAREGLRLGEARWLRWRHLDLAHGVLRLDTSKTGESRVWALSEDVARTFQAIGLGHHPDDPVFPGTDNVSGRKVAGGRKAAALFREHLTLAGIDRVELFERSKHRRPIRVHDLRATFITVGLAQGRSEAWICDRTGHRSSQMVNAYRRAARTATELGLGPLLPLDECLPELRDLASKAGGVPRVCRTAEPAPTRVEAMLNDFEAVRERGVEPPRLAALEPKSSASANSATRASVVQRLRSAGAADCQR